MHLPSAASITLCVSLLTSLAQLLLLYILSKKGLRSSFPLFFAYNVVYALGSVVVALGYGITGISSLTYFYIFWIVNTIIMVVEFALMYEVFVHAVKPYAGLIDLTKMLFGWAALFLMLAACLTAFTTAGSHLTKCVIATSYLDRGLRMMQCGVLILFFLFERRLGLSWRSPSVCIALGLGAVAGTGLSMNFLHAHYPSWIPALDVLSNTLYLAMVITWAICFRLPQPARKTVLDSPSKLIFQRWNEALLASPFSGNAGAMTLATADPFLPGVEKTVDRILARKMVS